MRASLLSSLRSFALALALLLLLLAITYSTAFAQDEGPTPYREFPVIGSRVAVWIAVGGVIISVALWFAERVWPAPP